MKSILIIDTPKDCDNCPCADGELGFCQADEKQRNCDWYKVPLWCPLKSMPKKIDIQEQEIKDFNSYPDKEFLADKLLESHGYERKGCCNDVYCGWNACVEELEK